MPENEDAVNVYMMTRWQFITVGDGAVADISIPAVKIAMDLLGVKRQLDCLTKVRALFHEFKPKREKK